MNTSFVIKHASKPKGALYKFSVLAERHMNKFAERNQAIFEGIARTAAPFGGNLLNSRF